MKIAMIGSGAAGSVFAAYLKKGGADDITLVDLYKAHMDKIAKDGLLMKDPTGEYLLKGYKTAATAENIGIMDIVIIMVKATQTDRVMSSVLNCIGPDTVVVSLQNGLGNDERLKKYVAEDRIIYGCGNMGTELPEPGVCISKPFPGNNMFFGPVVKCARTDEVGLYLEDCFTKGGIGPKYYDDVRPYVWRKATSNAGFNTVCAILRMKVKYVAANENGINLVWKIWREAADVSEALGIEGVWDYTVNNYSNVLKSISDYYPSMAQDVVINERETEVTCLTGAISDYGKKVGVPTPTCDILTDVIKCIEANYGNMYKG